MYYNQTSQTTVLLTKYKIRSFKNKRNKELYKILLTIFTYLSTFWYRRRTNTLRTRIQHTRRRAVWFLIERSLRSYSLPLKLWFHSCSFRTEFICCEFHICLCQIFRFLGTDLAGFQWSGFLQKKIKTKLDVEFNAIF